MLWSYRFILEFVVLGPAPFPTMLCCCRGKAFCARKLRVVGGA